VSAKEIAKALLALAAVLATGAVPVANAQDSYGRSTSLGTWTDGHWRTSSGPSGAPGESDYVYIGDASAVYGATQPAAVDLATTANVAALQLGNSAYGDLHVLSGGALTCGSVSVLNGLLDVQSGGALNSSSISLSGASAAAALGGTVTANSISLNSGCTASINAPITLAGSAYVSDSTLNLNAQLTVGDLSLSGAGVAVNRTSPGRLDLQNLYLYNGASCTCDGTDSIAKYVAVNSGTTFATNSELDTDYLSVSGEGATAAVHAASTFGMIGVDGGTLAIDADTASGGTYIRGGVLNLAGGTLSGNLTIEKDPWGHGVAAQVNQTGGHFNAPTLNVDGATSLRVAEGDNVTETLNLTGGATVDVDRDSLSLVSLSIGSDSVLRLTQPTGAEEGISLGSLYLAETGTLDVLFDAISGEGLDWGLRWDGDRRSELQALIDQGNLTYGGGSRPIGIVYDVPTFGDYTYLASVPEPSTICLLGLLAPLVAGRWIRTRARQKGNNGAA